MSCRASPRWLRGRSTSPTTTSSSSPPAPGRGDLIRRAHPDLNGSDQRPQRAVRDLRRQRPLQRLRPRRRGGCPGCGPGGRRPARIAGRGAALVRDSDGLQGLDRHQRLPTAERDRRLRGERRPRRLDAGRAAPSAGRGAARHHDLLGVLGERSPVRSPATPGTWPTRPEARARAPVWRRSQARRGGARGGDGRLDHLPGRVQRRLGDQALAGPGLDRGGDAALAGARHDRADLPLGPRHGADHELHDRPGPRGRSADARGPALLSPPTTRTPSTQPGSTSCS